MLRVPVFLCASGENSVHFNVLFPNTLHLHPYMSVYIKDLFLVHARYTLVEIFVDWRGMSGHLVIYFLYVDKNVYISWTDFCIPKKKKKRKERNVENCC